GGGPREATAVRRQLAPQVHEIERRESVQLTSLAEVELCRTLAQQLEARAEPALRPQRAFGDGALYAQLARREPHDLGGLAVAIGPEHDRGRGDERHRSKEMHTSELQSRVELVCRLLLGTK